jgi:hypothetical protein
MFVQIGCSINVLKSANIQINEYFRRNKIKKDEKNIDIRFSSV